MTTIEKAICHLANACDGAHDLDGVGFNKPDAPYGHGWARQIEGGTPLNSAQERVALTVLQKYKTQLINAGIDLDKQETVTSEQIIADLPKDELDEAVSEPEESNTPLPKPKEIILSEEQQEAANRIKEWAKNQQIEFDNIEINTDIPTFALGGYAGTGKTTLIKHLRNGGLKGYWVVAAFTGKAVHVLQRKGIRASTIHALIYNVVQVGKGQVEFELKQQLDPDADGIIIDEASMVSGELLKDLKSFGKPIIFVGDPGQLPPVSKDNPNIMRKPNFTLQTVHRQAAESPIIQFATRVRLGGDNYRIDYHEEPNLVIRRKALKASQAVEFDQIICATNKVKASLNEKMRAYKDLPFASIAVGEKLICLKNNSSFGVFNGMMFDVVAIKNERADHWETRVEDDIGNQFTLPIWKLPFQTELPKDMYCPRELVWCDYGYAITCHKSQGSEWDRVLVFDEWMPPNVWSMARWRYTAITRAAKSLEYLI